jgi:hypothetical protein
MFSEWKGPRSHIIFVNETDWRHNGLLFYVVDVV